jgi:hypothetical protein
MYPAQIRKVVDMPLRAYDDEPRGNKSAIAAGAPIGVKGTCKPMMGVEPAALRTRIPPREADHRNVGLSFASERLPEPFHAQATLEAGFMERDLRLRPPLGSCDHE